MGMKMCKVCGKQLCRKNKSGYCVQHLPRTAENNPFYGKTHSKETVELLKEKCKNATKKMWENDEYRKKVIEGATGLKRDESFKEKQRQHAIEQFKDNKQRKIRSKIMKENWQNGVLVPNKHSINESKQEKEFIKLLENKGYVVSNNTFRYSKNGKNKYLFPDGIIESEKIVLEYNGSFWHADPKRYKENDIIHHNKCAKDIWEEDYKKRIIYEENGYKVFVIWSDDFLNDKEKCVEDLVTFIKNKKAGESDN